MVIGAYNGGLVHANIVKEMLELTVEAPQGADLSPGDSTTVEFDVDSLVQLVDKLDVLLIALRKAVKAAKK